jgi:hypothetical protein
MFAGAIPIELEQESPPSVAQVVALDECDPATFNAGGFIYAVGGFNNNVIFNATEQYSPPVTIYTYRKN